MDGGVQCYLVTGYGFAGSSAASASRVECAASIPETIVTKNSLRRGLGGLVLALIACGSALAGNGPIDFSRTARLSLDANGKVDSLVFDDTKPGFAKVDARLESAIRQWAFVPGSIDGKPMPTQTTLSVELRATPEGNGDYAINVLGATTGLAFQSVKPPEYPSIAMQRGCEGIITVRVDVDGTGAPTQTWVESSDADCMKPHLEAAALTAAKQWRFNVETVGGHRMADQARVPVEFCLGISHGTCARWAKQVADSEHGSGTPASSNMHITSIHSQTKLRTQVAGTTLPAPATP
ncbi:MAG: energy transducer TonB [Proteobacteria bacterium]|nr:energy transducer TonB [Pseudomonadota bacterium]